MSLAEVYSNTDVSKGRNNSESQAAWQRCYSSAKTMRAKILLMIGFVEAQGYDTGVTPKEFATWIEKPLHSISGRFGDLAQLGLIQRTPHVRDGSRAWCLAKHLYDRNER